jgi:HJR/Mrr/RecB family endonuclease
MQFKDAAYEILKSSGKSLHYNEITNVALKRKILTTSGKTPHATMGALLYTDTLDDDSPFQREGKGKFALKFSSLTGIEQQIKASEVIAREQLRNHLLQMHPQKFEELIRALLEVMGFEETETTPYSNDKGIDVKGILRTNQLTPVKVGIQAKRWKKNVPAKDIRDLRGSLSSTGEQGIMITPKDYTTDAKLEAHAENKIPITLINGDRLVGLLFEYQLGIKEEQHTIHSIDTEYWREAFSVNFEPQIITKKNLKQTQVNFPISIQAQHRGAIYTAQLLEIKGSVILDGKEYPTPTTAAKVIATDWKQVNGWDFWRYLNPSNGKWEKIGKLR